MQLTRHSWEVLAICAVLLTVGLLGTASLWVFLAVVLLALFLSWQWHTAVAFGETTQALSIEYEQLDRSVSVSESALCRVHVSVPTPHPEIDVTVPRPVAADQPDEAQTLHLEPMTGEATCTFDTEFAVAGTHTLPAPRLTLTDAYGLFTGTVPTTQSPTMTVFPAVPRNVHVGQGGSDIAAFGEHEAGQRGSGIQPAELRQYQPGDATRHIDWKATARLNSPYVREFEAETDRQTAILLDQRASMGVGTAGQTMFAFARDVAASLADVAIEYGDPLGAYLLGDGLRAQPPATTPQHYRSVRQMLLQASEPTTSTASSPHIGGRISPTELSTRLAGDGSALAETIAPFLVSGSTVVTTEEATLGGAITRIGVEASREQWTTIITSDTDRDDLRAAVQQAQANSAAVSVFLTPCVLFETGSLSDLERAYARYVDFEEFRRSLSRQPRVEAYAVTPGQRLHSLLASQRAE